MLFTTMPVSTHEQVFIRPIEEADIAVWYGYLSLPEVFTHTSWNLNSADQLRHYVRNSDSQTPSSVLRFALALRGSNALVGTMGFHTVQPENQSAELTYDLSPSIWGRGVASVLGADFVAWVHEHVGLVRVQATVLESNIRSMRVLERIGFTREGLLRSYRMVRGTPGNFWMYSHVSELK